MSSLHYAGQSFVINESANLTWQSSADRVEEAVRAGGGFVDVPTANGLICFLFTGSIPAWFTADSPEQIIPTRIR